MKHELKIWPRYFNRVEEGSKTFEVRNNDRDFQAGDEVHLNEWDPDTNAYTARTLHRRVGYVLPIGAPGDDRVVFSLLKLV